MKQLLAAAMLSCACVGTHAQTADELLNNGRNPENVTTFGMGYDLKQYSPAEADQQVQHQAPGAAVEREPCQ